MLSFISRKTRKNFLKIVFLFGFQLFTMKKLAVILFSLLLMSCGSGSFQHFFNNHKADIGATSFQVPNFMRALLSAMSPEAKKVVDNITDFKYIQFEGISEMRRQTLIREMNDVTTGRYTDMFRKNEVNNVRLISVKEKGTAVTDVVIFYSSPSSTQAFYLRGLFDPNQLRKFSDKDQFSELTKELIDSYQSQISTPITE